MGDRDLPKSDGGPERAPVLPQDELATFEGARKGAPPTGDSPSLSQWSIATAAAPTGVPVPGGSPAGVSYTLLRPIARGGMGEVWQAIQVALGRVVAVKRVREELTARLREGERAALRDQIRQEAMVAARLEHPNILPIHDFGADREGDPLLAMKLVNGRPWTALIAEDWPAMPAADFLARHLPILVDVAQAVAFAHSRGIVHRDLKPAQVMVGEYGEVLLTDWGLAVAVDEARGPQDPTLPALPTRDTASSPSGTPVMMAPEQTEWNAARIGRWTDVYLLGGVLYFLLTRRYPHERGSAHSAFEAARAGVVAPPEERAPDREIPPQLSTLAMRCLRPEPEARVGSAAEFLGELAEYLSGSRQRRESQAIAEDVAARLARAGHGYREVSECLARLAQARALWGANPDAAALEDRALGQLAEGALANGDLVLARVHAERIADAARREPLLAAIARAEAHARRQASQRRLALAAVVTLLAVIGVGGAAFSVSLSAARREAEAQRDEANVARADALLQRDDARSARKASDGLVSFMISDLRNRIAPLDPTLKPLDEVAARAAAHYAEELESPSLDPEQARVAFEGLLRTADIFVTQGNLEATSATLASAGAIARRRADGSRWWELQGLVHAATEAHLLRTRGDMAESIARYEAVLPRLFAFADADPADRDAAEAAYSAASEAFDAMLVSKHPGHAAMAKEARRHLERLIALAPSADLSRQLVILQVQAAQSAIESSDEGLAMMQRATEMADALIAERPDDKDALTTVAFAHFQHGAMLQSTGAPAERALAAIGRAAEAYARLVGMAPETLDYRIGIGNSRNFEASLLASIGRAEEAEAAWKDGLPHLAIAAEKDGENGRWRSTHAAAVYQYAKFLAQQDRFAEADAQAAAAQATYETLIPMRPDHPTFRSIHLGVLQLRGSILVQKGDLAGAEARYREALAAAAEARALFPNSGIIAGSTLAIRAAHAESLLRLARAEDALAAIAEARAELPPLDANAARIPATLVTTAMTLDATEAECIRATRGAEAARHFAAEAVARWKPFAAREPAALKSPLAKLEAAAE